MGARPRQPSTAAPPVSPEDLTPLGLSTDESEFLRFLRTAEGTPGLPAKSLVNNSRGRRATAARGHDVMLSSYQHAIDSGVYLPGVDSSRIGPRRCVAREQIVDPAVLLIIGQSNGGNHGETRFTATGAVFNFNPFDGLGYSAGGPLLGATGEGGSPWCLLGDALFGAGFARSILLCPLSVGGATVGEWAPGGTYHHRMTYGLRRLREAGFWPSHVMWHQGEADALYGTSAAAYARSFRALVDSLRRLDVLAPIYIATASYFTVPEGYEANQAVIRAAQRSLIDAARAVVPGPDTDLIRDRFDGCHMGRAGLREHARAWEVVLQKADDASRALPPRVRPA